MDDQKKKEFKSLNRFFDLIGFKLNDNIKFGESPDFLIQQENSILGVEVTEIFQMPPEDGVYLQEQEKIKSDIISTTEDILKEKGIPTVKVYVSFNDNFRINIDTSKFALKKRDRYSIPKILVDIICNNIPNFAEKIEVYGVYCEKLPIQINSVHISREESYSKIFVGTSSGGILPPLDYDNLNKTINAKNNKINTYKEKCDECWLLIISNDIHFEKTFDLENSMPALDSCYNFEFNKVFFVEEAWGKVFDLKKCE